MATASKTIPKLKLPPAHDWRTTDMDESNKRRQHAREESFVSANTDARHPVFSNFHVKSASGLTRSVEVRGLNARESVCGCVDFRSKGLGFCKHVEAVLVLLQARHPTHGCERETVGTDRVSEQWASVDRAETSF